MMGFVMLAVSIIFSRVAAVIAGTAIAIFPIIVANIHYQWKQITFFSPFSWLDILLLDGTRGRSHLHALYGEHVGIFDLRTMEMTEGDLPKKAQELVKEWMHQNQKELLEMWNNQKLKKLPPL